MSDDLATVHARAFKLFNEVSSAHRDERMLAIEDRRFVSIYGAQWEGLWGEQFENSIRIQINKTQRGHDKVINDYRANRFMVDFRPVGDDGDDDTAELLNGLMYADMYRSNGQQALDNAFSEGAAGGYGAWELLNEYEDDGDPDNDHQRIRIDQIPDADVRVYFDLNAKLYDKSDAKRAWVLHSMTVGAFEEEYGEDKLATWPENRARSNWFDWFRPSVVYVARYYEVEEVKRERRTYTRDLTGEVYKFWAEDMTKEMVTDFETRGFTKATRMVPRKRIHMYIMSGNEILKDCGYIAGENIPIVPFYGKRVFIDNLERCKGHVRDAKDPARAYNAQMSKLMEIAALQAREVPIFDPEQVEGLQNHWANMTIDKAPYALARALVDPQSGAIVQAGANGYLKPPDVPPATAAIIQQMGNDIAEITNGDDQSVEIKSNVSGEAMDIAAARVDAKSYIYMDNFRLSMQRFGEIYLSMAKEVYVEEGREVEKMDEDGVTSKARLGEIYSNPKTGVSGKRYDLSVGRFNVVSTVTEATATRRDKTVRAMNAIAQQAAAGQDVELMQACLLTAIKNMDGEGLDDMKRWAHKRAVAISLDEMTPEEEAQAKAAQESQQPTAQDQALMSQARALDAQANNLHSQSELNMAKVDESHTKSVLNLADAHKKREEANRPPEPRPLPSPAKSAA